MAEGPCEWVVNTDCCPDWDTYEPAVQANAEAWATYILWALTGRRYGPCPVILRPCRQRCNGFGGYMTWPVDARMTVGAPGTWMIPWIDNGVWRNCGCSGSCSCRADQEIYLPGPVVEVTEVLIDGVALDPSAYRLDNGSILVRVDGGEWPTCQDMGLANDAMGAWAVSYTRGVAVPLAGQLAAGELACQFAKACSGSGDCQLPQQLASLSRSGVQVDMVDPVELSESGLTGIANVDLWIRAVNPARLAQRPAVRSGDISVPRFTV